MIQLNQTIVPANIRALHVLEDFSLQNTGVTSVVRQLTAWQAKRCQWVGVYVSGKSDLIPPEGVNVFESKIEPWSRVWRYPSGGSKKIEEILRTTGVDIVHVHGLWRASTLLAVKAALRLNLPIILSVHGQTSRWSLHGQGFLKRLKKKIYWAVVRAILRKLNCLHAITPLEQSDLKRFFGLNRSVIIPNSVNVAVKRENVSQPKKYFLFLGRLHYVKGIDNLIIAFMTARFSEEWQLIIAGPEENRDYAAMLKELAGKQADRIKFVGPVYGQEKDKLLAEAWALVAPSYTEVIGMVNLEAGALNTPSLTTAETGLSDWEFGGGLLVENGKEALRLSLETAASWSTEERIERGQRSRLLIEQRYSLDVAGNQWMRLYLKTIAENKLKVESL